MNERIRELAEQAGWDIGDEVCGFTTRLEKFHYLSIENMRADLLIQQGCCDGAAAQDARIQREREEHKAEVEKLREALRWYGARVRELSTPHDAVVAYSDLIDDSGEQARKALEGAP